MELKAPICHFPAGDGCSWCRAGVRHAHQYRYPYPTWIEARPPRDVDATNAVYTAKEEE